MMSKLQLDGILQERRKVVESAKPGKAEELERDAPKAKSPSPQKREDFAPEKSKSPTPKKEIPAKPQFEEAENIEDFQIPCEFCEVLIPISRLLIHQVFLGLRCLSLHVCYRLLTHRLVVVQT